MFLKSAVTAAAALALTVTPTLAAAQTVAPTEVAPAAEAVEDQSELRRTGILIPAAAILAIILAVILLTKGGDDQVSP